MQRLDQALAQQAGQLQSADVQLLHQRQLLLARETRVAAVRKLVERRAQDHQRVHARREQNRSDEATAQRHWHDSVRKGTVTH
jgi:flagellar FliJ protein